MNKRYLLTMVVGASGLWAAGASAAERAGLGEKDIASIVELLRR